MRGTQEVFSIISDALELPDSYQLKRETQIGDVPGWDSFAWIAVIGALEEYCATEFPLDRVDEIRNIGDLVDVVAGLR